MKSDTSIEPFTEEWCRSRLRDAKVYFSTADQPHFAWEFARLCQFSFSRLQELSNISSHCKELLDFLNRSEEQDIITRALDGTYNAQFAKFYLVNRHSFKPESAIEKEDLEKQLTVIVRGLEKK